MFMAALKQLSSKLCAPEAHVKLTGGVRDGERKRVLSHLKRHHPRVVVPVRVVLVVSRMDIVAVE